MPNFDSLRSAIIGPLEYICRPKEKPAELLALYPFDNSLNDISNFARVLSTSDYVFTNDGPFGYCISANGSVIHTETTQFTIDFFGNFIANPTSNYAFRPNCRTNQAGGLYGINNGQKYDVLCQLNTNQWFCTGYDVFAHYAVTYNGTTLTGYANGVKQFAENKTMNKQSIIQLYKGAIKISNLRVLGICLTTGSTFPVPTDFYTGFEPI